MKHTTGFELGKVKRGKYQAYRNYFCAGEPMPEFEDLVSKELVVKKTQANCIYYYLTPLGIEFLSEITGVKITEMD
jgi:hypothetical protein